MAFVTLEDGVALSVTLGAVPCLLKQLYMSVWNSSTGMRESVYR